MTTTTTTDQSGSMFAVLGIVLFIYAAIAIAMIVAWVFIIRKAGYSGWLVLLGIIPVVNIVMFFVFAFKKWPVTIELERLRAGIGSYGHGYPLSPGYRPGYGPQYGQQPWEQPGIPPFPPYGGQSGNQGS